MGLLPDISCLPGLTALQLGRKSTLTGTSLLRAVESLP